MRLYSVFFMFFVEESRSLSNDDGDIKENGKKSVRFYWQNNNSASASRRFFVHFSAVTARLRRSKMPNFSFCGGRDKNKKAKTLLFFS